MNLEGWAKETPSRSTTLTPIAAASRRTSTMWFVEEVDLVDVEDVAVGLGEDAGLEFLEPVRRAASMSMVPTTRSSEALIGSSTTRMRLLWEGRMRRI